MLIASIFGSTSCARSGPRDGAPEATLARTGAASIAFSNLRRSWSGASSGERVAMAPYLRDLRKRYGTEPVARMADVYLAWVALEQGAYDEAAARAASVEAGHGGNTRDLATLLDGATLSRRGWPDAALAKLLPLLGTLLDPYARELLYEEAERAALAAHRYSDAIDVLDAWLRDATDEDVAATLVRVDESLTRLPETALEQARERLSEPGHSELLTKAIGKRLAAIAVERGDAALARRLLRQGAGVGSLGAEGATVLQLANVDEGTARVSGRTVGFVAETEPMPSRQRSAEASLGILAALGLVHGDEARTSGARVVQRETTNGVRKAASGLVDAGAVVIVGGLTAEASTELAAFAEEAHVATILLVPPARVPTTDEWAFVIGVDDDAVNGILVNALAANGARVIAVVGAPTALIANGDARVLPSVDCPHDRAVSLPFADWKSAGVDALLIAGNLDCADAITRAVHGAHGPLRLALGDEASALVLDDHALGIGGAIVPRMGRWPVDDAGHFAADLRALGAARGEPITWWTLLGREVGDALFASLPAVSDSDVDDDAEVQKRRLTMRDTLRKHPPGRSAGLAPRSLGIGPPAPNCTAVTGR